MGRIKHHIIEAVIPAAIIIGVLVWGMLALDHFARLAAIV